MRLTAKDKSKLATIILRVSGDSQRNNYSHPVQDKVCREYCVRNGLVLVDEPVKLTESAKESENRKEYHAAIKAALKVGCMHVVFFMQDREARNPTDVTENIKLVRQGKVVLHYAHENKRLDRNSSASEFTMRQMQGVMDWQYSMVLSEKVTLGQRHKAEQGEFPGGRLPLGYMHLRPVDKDGKVIPRAPTSVVEDQNEQNVRAARRMFALRAQRFSLRQIERQVLLEGFRTSKGRPFSKSGIEWLLRNKFYWGRYDWEGKEYQGNHAIIIPREDLDVVAMSFGKRGRRVRSDGDDAVFRDWLRCGHPTCGMQITFERMNRTSAKTQKAKVYGRYHCSNSRHVHESLKGLYVSGDKIFGQFEPAVAAVAMSPKLAEALSLALNGMHVAAQKETRDKIREYEGGIERLRADEDTAYDNLGKGTLDADGYRHQLARIHRKQGQLADLLRQAQLSVTDIVPVTPEMIYDLAADAPSLWKSGSPAEKVQMLKNLCSKPVLDGQVVRYSLRQPFAALSSPVLSDVS